MSEEQTIQSSGPLMLADWIEDDEVVRTVRQTRLAILDNQLAYGVFVDKDSFEMMHKNLQELDKGAFKSKQLKQEEKSSEAQAKLAMEISNVLAKQLGSRDIFEAKETEVVETTQIPNPTHLLGVTQPLPGELKVGDDTSSYEEFSNTVGKALDEARKSGKAE